MTHAYQEIYLSNAQALLGDAFDYAINACGVAGDSFIKLFSVSSVSNRIENGEPSYLYSPLHEADVTKFADIVDAKVREYFADTNLKRIRTLYGCTQAELAKRSNVSLRSIQMYEQRNKDINKASAETVLSLAKVLGCTMEDLLET